jgi:hypothetical protein
MGVEGLAHFFKVMRGCAVLLEVNASFSVIFANCGMRNRWSMSRSQLRERSRWQYWVLHYYVHQTCNVLLHYESSKRCVCPLYKFVFSFKSVKLSLKHRIYFQLNFQRELHQKKNSVLKEATLKVTSTVKLHNCVLECMFRYFL